MQRIHALQVALKDRPKIFQAIVLSLFSLSVLSVLVCGAYAIKPEPKTSVATNKQAKPAVNQPAYASFAR